MYRILGFKPKSGLIAARRNLVECPQCGEFNRLPDDDAPGSHFCHRCDHRLHRQRWQWMQHAQAGVISGLLLFLVSNIYPFLTMNLAEQQIETTLLSGVSLLLARGELLLALLVLMTTFLLPLLELLAIGYLVLACQLKRKLPGGWLVLSVVGRLQHWNMLEVFLLAVLVTSVKLNEMAEIIPGPGLYGFLCLVLALQAVGVLLNRRALWTQVNGHDYFIQGGEAKPCGCLGCGALVDHRLGRCPRCYSIISPRIPQSLQKTWGFLIAAIILYVPANTLPMMFTTSFGATQSDTILSGVIYLMSDGQWAIALIVLVASVFVPIFKIVVMLYLLLSTGRLAGMSLTRRLKLYRVTEFIGRWSMVDVYVVILMMALVQFGVIANVEPGGAALSFGCVVVLTMLAADSYDPRLIWDIKHDGTRS